MRIRGMGSESAEKEEWKAGNCFSSCDFLDNKMIEQHVTVSVDGKRAYARSCGRLLVSS